MDNNIESLFDLYGVFHDHMLGKVFDDLDAARKYVRMYVRDRPTDEQEEAAKHYCIRCIAHCHMQCGEADRET